MKKHTKKLSILSVAMLALGSGCGADDGSPSVVPADAQTSPESVVEAFYSAVMSGDEEAALSLVADEYRDEVAEDLEEMSNWVYTSVEVVEYADPWVTIDLEVEIDGDTDGGTDEVEVVEIDGTWWIADIPS